MFFRIINVAEHRISATTLVSIHRPPYRASQADKEKIKKHTVAFPQRGLIRLYMSPCAAAVIMKFMN